MSERIDLAMLRSVYEELAEEDTAYARKHKLCASHVLALVEAVEAAHEERNSRNGIWGYLAEHSETDEVTCACGYEASAEDYTAARKQLEAHMRYHVRKSLARSQAVAERANRAFAHFSFDGGGQ